ncbi:hypothetical protein [Aquimarina algicola]|uniref:Uncharacterized protein n=1 Tax=Aquimarina algicola TaxID=2589995 RepID=A0A504J8B2_9FLAO|nr:hypothetical protein [Aquimarina algicola]TPN87126.1 hypothetical protein FHK87_05915 [Aquimarina algicola]
MPIEINIQNKLFVVPESNDPCLLWVDYFNALKTAVGIANARTIWLVTWKTNGSSSCTTNGDFNRWLKKNKIDVSNAATRAIADASEIGSNFMGLGKNLSKVASIAVPVTLTLLLAVIGMILWNTAKKADVTDLAMLTPMGKSIGGGIKFLNK